MAGKDAGKVELEVILKSKQSFQKFKAETIADFRKLEKELGTTFNQPILLKVNALAVKAAVKDVQELNRELAKAQKLGSGMLLGKYGRSPSTGSSQKTVLQGGGAAGNTKQAIADLKQIQALEMAIARSRAAEAKSLKLTDMRKQLEIQKELLRHTQMMQRIKLSIVDPSQRAEAERLAKILNGVNLAKIKAEFDSADKSVQKSMTSMRNVVASTLGNILANVASFSAQAIAKGAGAVVGAAGDAIKRSMTVGSDLNAIGVLGGLNPQQLQAIDQTGKEISTTYGKTRQEIGGIAIDIAQAGIGQDKLNSYLKETVKLSIATRSNADVATASLIKLANNFGLTETQASDILTQGANRSVSGLTGLNTSLQYSSNSAKKMGISAEQNIGLTNLLTSSGLEDSRAGTALDAAYRNVARNPKIFEDLGIDIYDMNGNLKQGIELFQTISDAFTKLSDKQKLELFSKGFDKDGNMVLEVIGKIREENRARYDEEMAAMKANAGVSQDVSKKMMEDPAKKADVFLRKVEQIQENLGKAFAPGVNAAIEFGSQVAQALSEEETLFQEINQAANEFAQYLKDNPEIVQETVAFLKELASIIGGTILDMVRDWVEFTTDNKTAYEGLLKTINLTVNALTGLAGIVRDLVKLVFELVNGAAEVTIAIGKWVTPLNSAMQMMQAFNAEQAKANQMKPGFGGAVNQGVSGSRAGIIGGGNNEVQISEAQMYQLAALAIAESSTREGRTDVAQAVFNRINGGFGADVTEVAFAPGQFEPYFGVSPQQTSTRAGAIAFLRSRGYSEEQAIAALDQSIGDFSNPEMMGNSAQHVGGRTSFKGVSQYGNMVSGEDRLRQQGENFYHIDSGQTYGQLAQYQQQAPSAIVMRGAARGGDVGVPDRVLNPQASTGTGARSNPGSSAPSDISERADAAIAEAERRERRSLESTIFRGVQVTSPVDASGEPGLDYVVAGGERGAQAGSLTRGRVIEVVDDQNWETNLESNPGGQRGYGNRVIVRTVDEKTGELVDMLYAHFDDVAVRVGDEVAVGTVLGTQGRTGSTTGAHVSVDFFGQDSNAATPAALAMRDRYAQLLANDPNKLNAEVGTVEGKMFSDSYDARERAEKEAERAREEAEKKRREALEQSRRNQDQAIQVARQQEDSRTEQQRSLRRAQMENEARSRQGMPGSEYSQDALEVFDLNAEKEDKLRELTRELEDLRKERERLNDAERQSEKNIGDVKQRMDEAIAQTQSMIQSQQQLYDEKLKTIQLEREATARGMETENAETQRLQNQTQALREVSLAWEEFMSGVTDSRVGGILQAQREVQTVAEEAQTEIANTRVEMDKLQESVDNILASGIGEDDPIVKALQERIRLYEEAIANLEKNSEIEIRIRTVGANRASQQILDELSSNQQSAQSARLRQMGLGYTADRQDQAFQAEQERRRYQEERSQFQMLEGRIPADEYSRGLSSIDAAHAAQAETINKQFDTLTQLLPTLQQGFGSLLQGMATDFSNLGQIALGVLDSIISKLIEMGAMKLFEDLFGMLLGGGGTSAGDSSMMDVTGSSASYAASGTLANYAKGKYSLSEAYRRERSQSGYNPYLAVVNDKEIILSATQSARFRNLGLSDLVMSSGNLSRSPVAANAIAPANISYSPNYTVNGGGGDLMSAVKIADERARTVFYQEMQRQQRPNSDTRRSARSGR